MANFSITGVESVQAVQTPDGRVPLIANKTTVVRVYVKTDSPVDVSGRLTAQIAAGGTRDIAPLTVDGKSSVSLTATAGSDRNKWESSLNFQLDADMTGWGTREISVRIYSVDDGDVPSPPIEHLHDLPVTFHPVPDLHVYGVVWKPTPPAWTEGAGVTYDGPAAPWSDFEGHRQFVENVYPVAGFMIDPIPGIGTTPPSPQTFTDLLGSRAWAHEKQKELPPQSIINILDPWDDPGLHGITEGLVTEEQNERSDGRLGKVMAQEVAHALGLAKHTFDPGSPYPFSDGHIPDSDVGIDIRESVPLLVPGSGHFDIMSYETETWTSSFTYHELLTAITGRAPFQDLGGEVDRYIVAVSWGPDRLDLFSRGVGNVVSHKFWDGKAWGPSEKGWESLGGEGDGPIAVTSWGKERLDVFARASDSTVRHLYWDPLPGGWNGWKGNWENLGGPVDGALAAVSWGPNRIDLFARAPTGALRYKSWRGKWYPEDAVDSWVTIGDAKIDGDIVTTSWGKDRFDLFVRWVDGTIRHLYWTASGWSGGPWGGPWENLGGATFGELAAVCWAPNRIDLFVRGATNQAVYHKYWDGKQWHPTQTTWNLLGGYIEGGITAVSWHENRLDVYVRGANGSVYHKYWNGHNWGPDPSADGWQNLGDHIAPGLLTSVSWGPDRAEVFGVRPDGTVLHKMTM